VGGIGTLERNFVLRLGSGQFIFLGFLSSKKIFGGSQWRGLDMWDEWILGIFLLLSDASSKTLVFY
jgi:hypothetical protein